MRSSNLPFKIFTLLFFALLISPHFVQSMSIDSLFNYFPLKIGNFWFYKDSYSNLGGSGSFYYRVSIIDTVRMNGHFYFKISNSRDTNHAYTRIDSISGNVFNYNLNSCQTFNRNEDLIDSLNAKINNQNNYLCNNESKVLSDTSNILIFNIYAKQENFTRHTSVQIYQNRYVYNIGQSFYSYVLNAGHYSSSEIITLLGCHIGDSTYGVTTEISNLGESSLIADYKLSQNYPNPFNPTTKINFDLKNSAFASLKVFDITGREVRTLVNEKLSAGSYSYDFNASELPSGVYFYQLKTDGFIETKKMILLK